MNQESYLYKKIKEHIAKKQEEIEYKKYLRRKRFMSYVASTFRLNKNDMIEISKELEQDNFLRKSKKKYKI